VHEVCGVIDLKDRMFKRKNRFDVLLGDGSLLSLSAPTLDAKQRFSSAILETCSPSNSNIMNELRRELTTESRKVISLTTLVETWKTRYKDANRKHLAAQVKGKDGDARQALEVSGNIRFFLLFCSPPPNSHPPQVVTRIVRAGETGSVSRAFHILKTNATVLSLKSEAEASTQAIMETTGKRLALERIAGAVNGWQNAAIASHFGKWARITHAKNVSKYVPPHPNLAGNRGGSGGLPPTTSERSSPLPP
jgi:hypothetical protein